ncbi:stress protein [Parafrankia colletiae]|uniref:Stress protein n=1 Tax=Parafrankia colletiae TaxID=573497 RepID=A0A1S1QD27_9ACTN|nr:universal stress protein [Parafrankia colletiae]MCK9902525.1 universal stress protein [Frankia sp. Cpl3]OHV31489.1 stress protein [Parafrankia colletiae]
MQHIVAGVDTREAAPAALARAADLSRRLGAELDVVHVQTLSRGGIRAMVSTVPGRHLSERFLRADQDARTREVRTLVERTLASSDVPWRLHVLAGDPAAHLLAVADSVDAYAIVIGTRHGGGVVLERLLTGSVSHRVVNWAKRPVLVVPTDLDD